MTSSGGTGAPAGSTGEGDILSIDDTEPVQLEEVPDVPEPGDEWDGDTQDEQDVLEDTEIVDGES